MFFESGHCYSPSTKMITAVYGATFLATTSRAARVGRLCRGSLHRSARTDLALDGVDAAASFLIPARPDWPRFEVMNTTGRVDRVSDRLGEDRAEITLRSGGMLFLDRLEARAEFVTPEPMSPDELAHPGLAPVAAVTARWFGRQSFHAGAFALGTDVWGAARRARGREEHDARVAGLARASRSSATTCSCSTARIRSSARGFSISAQSRRSGWGWATTEGRVGLRERWRVQLDEVPAEAALQGLGVPRLGR